MKFLSKKIVKQLSKKKLKISVAESCTGGMLSNIITSNAGSSKIFNLGLITYSNKSKIDILRIPANIIRKYGSVSKHVGFAMVKNLSKISKSDINVSITGIAGPSGGTQKKPVGLVYVAVKKKNKITIIKYLFNNRGRINIQKAAVNKALRLILTAIK